MNGNRSPIIIYPHLLLLGGTKCAIGEVGVNVRRVIVKIEVTINW